MIHEPQKPLSPRTASPPLSFSERVRSLRLPDAMERGAAPRSARLPWILCFLFACSTGYLLIRNTGAAIEPSASAPDSPGLSSAESNPGNLGPGGRPPLSAGGY